MKKKAIIYSFSNSNMAGHEWLWTFTLQRAPDGTFTLSAKQKLIRRDRGDEPFDIDPVTAITSGSEVYEQLCEMLSDPFVDDDPTALDGDEIAAAIATIDVALAEEFLVAKGAADEEDEDEILPTGAIIHNGRLSKAEEMALYKKMDSVVAVIRGPRPAPEPAKEAQPDDHASA